jgi:hypothetical protein
MVEPIGKLCTDPAHTRARAAAGEPVPCYRCLAWDGIACFFIVTGQRPHVDKPSQPTPTTDTLWGPPEREET